MLDRRHFLGLVGVGAATLAGADLDLSPTMSDAERDALAAKLGGGHSGHQQLPTQRPQDAGTRPAVTKFAAPLALLPTARPTLSASGMDTYVSRIRPVAAAIFPGHQTSAFGYFGSWVPPVIRTRQGRRTIVVQRNETAVPVSVHLHGGVTRAIFDGQMSTPIAPGSSFAYVYDNDQSAAALWMHDHTHMTDAQNVYRGMASPYIIGSDEEDALGLPSKEFEIPLMLRDGDFDSEGRFIHVMDDTANRSTVLVNGRPWPRLDVRARKYRFRVINSSNMRFFVLGLSDGGAFTSIGGDGGLFPAPFETQIVSISPGERADLVLDFSRYAPGTSVDLINYIGPGNMDDVGQVMRFVVGEAAADDSTVPDTLIPMPALRQPDRTREFTLLSNEPGVTPMAGSINGRAFSMKRIDHVIPFGTTEEWVVTNANATVPHNFHCHLAHMRVVSRGAVPVGPEESGWKDTVQVFPGQSVRLRLTFDTHRGTYPLHCHMLDHGAMGMMQQFQVR